jgi:hypothetical protein
MGAFSYKPTLRTFQFFRISLRKIPVHHLKNNGIKIRKLAATGKKKSACTRQNSRKSDLKQDPMRRQLVGLVSALTPRLGARSGRNHSMKALQPLFKSDAKSTTSSCRH